MTPLPQPDDLTSMVLRTDFSDDVAWRMLRTAIDGSDPHSHATYVSDPAYAGVTIQALIEADVTAGEEQKLTYIFLADATTMATDEHLLLAVDLYDEPGRTFRVPPNRCADISANLTSANLDFADFADAADESGVYRG